MLAVVSLQDGIVTEASLVANDAAWIVTALSPNVPNVALVVFMLPVNAVATAEVPVNPITAEISQVPAPMLMEVTSAAVPLLRLTGVP